MYSRTRSFARVVVPCVTAVLLPLRLPAQQQQPDTLHIPVLAIDPGGPRCRLGTAPATADTSVESLSVLVLIESKDSVPIPTVTPDSLEFWLRGTAGDTVRRGVMAKNQPSVLLTFTRAEVQGRELVVVRGNQSFVCGADFPAVSESDNTALTFATGVSFASADGFTSKQTRVPITAMYRVRFPVWKKQNIWLSFDLLAEATSLVKTRTFVVCDSATATVGSAPSFTASQCPASTSTQFKSNPDSFRVVTYTPRVDATKNDTSPETGNIWQSIIVARLDWAIPSGSGLCIGPAAALGFQTNPNVPSIRSLGVTRFIGLSVRQLGKATGSTDRLGLLVLYGRAPVFPVAEVSIKPAGADTTMRSFRTPLPEATVGTWAVRLELSPLAGWTIRGMLQTSRGYPDTATLSIMKSIDVAQTLSSIFGNSSAGGSGSSGGGSNGGTSSGGTTAGAGSGGQ